MCQTCGKAGEGQSVKIELRYIIMLELHPACVVVGEDTAWIHAVLRVGVEQRTK